MRFIKILVITAWLALGMQAIYAQDSIKRKNLDDLPLNKVQVIGSHNSYKQPIDKPMRVRWG
jgi:hypothetical protein